MIDRWRTSRCFGFTLIELICVILILAVTAGLIAPRISSNDARAMNTKAEAIADFFSFAAKRDALADEPLRIEYDREAGELRLLVLRSTEVNNSYKLRQWVSDPLAPDADVSSIALSQLYLDGTEAYPDEWTIEFPQTTPRQTIVAVLEPAGAELVTRRWIVELLPYETKATIRSATKGTDPLRNRAVDLDDAGRGDVPW